MLFCAMYTMSPILTTLLLSLKIKSVAYSSQGNHTGQLDFCNWLAVRRDNVINMTLRQV